ncbi:MAG: 1-acyl-sn-glycerol-3-phosphate acyltransferase [bacterium ADurb.Bin236]|nr:MAG: 1-acyl-sn-glycerol-3-phosphate acyltransferase [bacterium ADurb.Bin236]HOY63641.1 lysophospholipid acyltransferase family protein [bacterium]HPN95784.1 lysophospholipid acyltransferase family protein [bacterium]
MADEKLYFMIRDALAAFLKFNNRMEVSGTENIPSGGALVCPNHTNYSDPFFLGAAVEDRVMHFLAWHGIAEMPLVGPLFSRIGTMHPIHESYGVAEDKNEVREKLDTLRDLLKSGELCVIFPEGTIKHWIRPGGDELDEFKPGATRLAAQAGVPILPVAMTGTRWVVANIINYHDWGGPDKGFWIPSALPVKVRVRIGKPFRVDPAAADDREVNVRESERLRDVISDMLDEMRGRKR